MCSGGFSPGHAMDMILTGRGVSGDEAQRMGLTNRLVGPGEALEAAIELANQLASISTVQN
jgi:enoyl-CoA hydratase/carnithine racemase